MGCTKTQSIQKTQNNRKGQISTLRARRIMQNLELNMKNTHNNEKEKNTNNTINTINAITIIEITCTCTNKMAIHKNINIQFALIDEINQLI